MGFPVKLLLVSLPAVAAGCLLSQASGPSAGGQAAGKAKTLIPSYAREIKEFQREVVFEMRTADGKAVGNGVAEFVQPTVLGYVNAKHPAVRNYSTQRVFEQRFFVDGREIPYVDVRDAAGKVDRKKVPASGAPYWTTLPDIKVGYDVTHIYARPANPGSAAVRVVGLYKGYTFTPPRWDSGKVPPDAVAALSTKLSAQERKLFLMSEIGPDKDYSHEAVRAILSGHGMLRKNGEGTLDYVRRFQKWAIFRFRYDRSNGTERHLDFIRSGGAGNCNPLAAAYELCLRSQGVPTRIVSGISNPDGTNGHSFTQFFDDASGVWLNFFALAGHNSPEIAYGDYSPDVFPFQPYSRYWYQSTVRADDGISSGNQGGNFYGFTGTNSDGVLDPGKRYYNMRNTWIREVRPE